MMEDLLHRSPGSPVVPPPSGPRELTAEQHAAFWAATQAAVLAVLHRPVSPEDQATVQRIRALRERAVLERTITDATPVTEPLVQRGPAKRL